MTRILISIPLIVVLIAFALSNQQPVRVGIWPTDLLFDLPLSVAVLIAAALFFIVGALMPWTPAHPPAECRHSHRASARPSEHQGGDGPAAAGLTRHA